MGIKSEYLPTEYWTDSEGSLHRAYFEYEDGLMSESPREWSNLTVIVNASSYCLTGSNDVSVKDIEEYLIQETGINENWYYSNYRRYGGVKSLIEKFRKEKCIAFEYLSVYDHSGITVRCGLGSGWDVSNVGFVYVPKDSAEVKDYMKKHGKEETEKWAKSMLEGEVRTLADYCEGNVYCLVHEKYDEEFSSWEVEDTLGDVYLTSDTCDGEMENARNCIKDNCAYSGCKFITETEVNKAIEENTLDVLLHGQKILQFMEV